ncbi:MBL fold metallo-hydrolase [Aquirufa rosea]|uniref:MBL fold metallo-hydrolase n=1 Tax=Aquirufa rosea TaxID=2509241 RepID=A0A4Q1BZ75_9BACT|nr:MBL fold metallo-hydrolase [Aquirufa rosea]RXK48801.1 MBL fold metallo-hydrolase [Aquirufa rosea]
MMKRRRMLGYLGILTTVSLGSIYTLNKKVWGANPKGKRLQRIQNSPHYNNGEFQNLSYTPTFAEENNKIGSMFRVMTSSNHRTKPSIALPSLKPNLASISSSEDYMIWLGHSSYLFQIEGKTLLIDPVLSGFAAPFSWMNSSFPGTDPLTAEELPDIDYLLISHDHYDHLDYATIQKIINKVKRVICGLGVGAHLEHWGYSPDLISEIDWHESITLEKDWQITATPARHFSGRGIQRNKTLWVSFVLKTNQYNLFLGGDSGYDSHFKSIGEQYGPFDLALIEQGQYNQAWKYIHLMPEEIFTVAQELQAKKIFAGHNSKFKLSVHPWDEPMKLLWGNSQQQEIPIITPKIGEVVYLNRNNQVFSRWWEGII